MNFASTDDLHQGPMRRHHALLLTLIVIAAAAFRLYAIDRESLDTDELFSVQFAAGVVNSDRALPLGLPLQPPANTQVPEAGAPWWKVWSELQHDTHPPLYFLALRGWCHLFGSSDFSVRMPSVIASVLTLLLLFDAVRVLSTTRAALWAVAIAAVAGPLIQYAQECRSYIFMCAMSAATCAVGARLVTHGASHLRCAVLAALSLGAMLTHYWAAGFLMPLALAVITLARPRLRIIFWLGGAAVVFSVFWGPFFLKQLPHFQTNLGWIADDDPGLGLRTARRAAIVPLRLLYTPPAKWIDAATAGQWGLWVVSAAAFLLPWIAWRADRRTAVFAAAFLGPIALVAAADLVQHRQTLNLIRYTLPAAVGLIGLLAIATARLPGWRASALPAFVLLACLIALHTTWDRQKPDRRAFVKEAARDLSGEDAIVVIGDRDARWQRVILYSTYVRYAGESPQRALFLEDPATVDQLQFLRGSRRAVVLASNPDTPIEAILSNLPQPASLGWVPEVGAYWQYRFDSPATAPSPAAGP